MIIRRKRISAICVLWLLDLLYSGQKDIDAFPVGMVSQRPLNAIHHARTIREYTVPTLLYANDPKQEITSQDEIKKLSDVDKSSSDEQSLQAGGSAATNTINERLMAELQEAKDLEIKGPRSSAGKKLGLDSFRSQKSEEERQAAIEAARDLNGVNPLVALGGGIFALAGAAGLWALTNFLGAYFAMHPVQSDVYFVERVTAVFRNVVVGLVSLASGFFGVTGLGILLLGIQVAVGVAKGELDPTPIKKSRGQDEVEMPNVWDLMLNKKPGRRGGKRNNNDKNPFGL